MWQTFCRRMHRTHSMPTLLWPGARYHHGPLVETFAEAISDGVWNLGQPRGNSLSSRSCPEVPAALVDTMAASAAHEAAGLTYKCPGTDKNRTTTKNSSRTVRRMLKRLGMNWNIPITTAQFPVNGADDLEVLRGNARCSETGQPFEIMVVCIS